MTVLLETHASERRFSLVSRGQTAYFSFDMGAEKNKGLAYYRQLHVLCRESPDFGDC